MPTRSKYEFVNRMQAQREVIELINLNEKNDIQLCGLSVGAVESWYKMSEIKNKNNIKKKLEEISSKLSFLASESQQQISKKYENIESEFKALFEDLKAILN